jgi:hypothetical protein
VLAHAPGERQHLLLLLGVGPLGLAAVGLILPARLFRRLDLAVVQLAFGGMAREVLGDGVPAELRVGEVGEAVLAHASGERQRLPEIVAAAGIGIGGGGLAGAAQAGHPAGLVVAAAAGHGQRQQQQAEQQPDPDPCHRRPPRRAAHGHRPTAR